MGDLQQEMPKIDAAAAGVVNGPLEAPAASINTKRQRRPSVRLGEIGDQSISFMLERTFKRKKRRQEDAILPTSPSEGQAARVGFGRPPRIRPLEHVSHDQNYEQVSLNGHDDEGGGDWFTHGSDMDGNEDKVGGLSLGQNAGNNAMRPALRTYVKRGRYGKRKRASGTRTATAFKAKRAVYLAGKTKENQSKAGGDTSGPVLCNGNATEQEQEDDLMGANQKPSKHSFEYLEKRAEDSGKMLGLRSHGHGRGHGDVEWDTQEHRLVNDDGSMPDDELDDSLDSEETGAAKDHENMIQPSKGQDFSLKYNVQRWLDGLGLGKYADIFELHEVDNDVLPLLTMDDLREMGIGAVGARRKMFHAIQDLTLPQQ